MTNQNALQILDNSAVSNYGGMTEIKTLAHRIQIMVPGGRNLKSEEAQALAQVALVTNCDPFIGEIWYIPGKGPMIGIRGARRHGNVQIEQAGGLGAYWTPEFIACSGADAGFTGKDTELASAYKCVITDSVSSKQFQTAFIETVNTLRVAGSKDPVGEAREICGKRPEWIGYGFATINETSRMNKQALARKRAEADALKRRFYIPFGANIAAGDDAIDAGAQEWTEGTESTTPQSKVTDIDLHEMTIEEARQTIIINSNGNEKFMGELPAETLNKAYLSDKTTDAQKRAAAMILKIDYSMDAPK